jgi:tetratricopeptide (TPR) repeat protein
MHRHLALSIAIGLILCAQSAHADSDATKSTGSASVIQQAIKEYKAGNIEKAATLLQADLEKNPEDGVTHYYLGLIKQRVGDDAGALDQLEWAARLCPPEMITSLTKQVADSKGTSLPKVPAVITPKADWFGMFGNSVTQMFSKEKPAPKITESGDIQMPPPILFGSMDDLWKQGRSLVRDGVDKAKELQGKKEYKSWAANVMPMDDMMDLVDKSKSIYASKWASHSDGLSKFRQSPENTPSWDAWISRFSRSFQHVLTAYLAQDAKNQVTGRAACIFSIDKRGNLRGHIYASTGDGVLNGALLKTIQTLNHSRILEFPPESKVTGWNFRMTWNFGQILGYIRAYRIRQALIEKQAQEEIIAKQTEALLLAKKKADLDAKAQRLKALREKQIARAKAKLLQLQSIKTDVSGIVLPAAKPLELSAVAMSLSDPKLQKMPKMIPATPNFDPFANISDQEIMSWPNLNR